ncbi:lysine-rich arabinogalactan protein 19-like [Schistocerca piceifrons]|uniref:lysine-rich arabinogalactan protein 19-like n=1 Tax=Schistocerca piceifrons TaxID=274613 RepID=UPI001F5FADBB|nr:lysine-rich arabinogalactan protein 19-like [Schistocerca piceifrons]
MKSPEAAANSVTFTLVNDSYYIRSLYRQKSAIFDPALTTTKAAAEPQIATAARSNSVKTAAPAKPATSEPAQATKPITAAAQATEAEMVSTTVAVPLQSLAEKRRETTGISNYRAKPTDTTTTDPPPTETVPIKESKAATARRILSAPPHPLPLPPPPAPPPPPATEAPAATKPSTTVAATHHCLRRS